MERLYLSNQTLLVLQETPGIEREQGRSTDSCSDPPTDRCLEINDYYVPCTFAAEMEKALAGNPSERREGDNKGGGSRALNMEERQTESRVNRDVNMI